MSVEVDEAALAAYGGLAAVYIQDDHAVGGSVDRTVFASSNKNNAAHGDWTWDTGNVPAKGDLTNVFAYSKVDDDPDSPTSGDLFIFAGLERISPDGAAHVDIEINQETVFLIDASADPDGGVSCDPEKGQKSCKFDGEKTDGDLLIVMDFENGVGEVDVMIWNGALGEFEEFAEVNGVGCNVATASVPANLICAYANNQEIDGGDWDNLDKKGNVISSNILPINAFTEFGLNISLLFEDLLGTSIPKCFTNIIFKSRSSPSVDSSLLDFAISKFSICEAVVATEIHDIDQSPSVMVFPGPGVVVEDTNIVEMVMVGRGRPVPAAVGSRGRDLDPDLRRNVLRAGHGERRSGDRFPGCGRGGGSARIRGVRLRSGGRRPVVPRDLHGRRREQLSQGDRRTVREPGGIAEGHLWHRTRRPLTSRPAACA